MRWEAFLAWNNRTGEWFGPDDVLGFGDADEIPSSHNVHLLKHCEMAGPSVDIGIWFTWGRLDRAFRSDWPVPGNPWTLGDPAYWTLRSALAHAGAGTEQWHPSRMRETSKHHLLGGVHLTENAYPPFGIAKVVACTECGEVGNITIHRLRDSFVGKVAQSMTEDELMHKLTAILDRSVYHKDRVVELESVKVGLGQAYYVPWYLKCYPDKYPTWFGKHDGRVKGKPVRVGHERKLPAWAGSVV